MAAWGGDHDGGNNRAVQDQLKEVDAFLGQILSRAKRHSPKFSMDFFLGATFCIRIGWEISSNYRFWNHVWPFESVSKVEKSVGHWGMLGNTLNRPGFIAPVLLSLRSFRMDGWSPGETIFSEVTVVQYKIS